MRETVQCQYFKWIVSQRNYVYQADGRSNRPPVGRHSLGTKVYERALQNLKRLDLTTAVDLGLAPTSVLQEIEAGSLALKVGKDEYLGYVARPRALRGGSKNTQKRYRAVFTKAVQFFESRGIKTWNQVTDTELQAYTSHLEGEGYAHATQVLEAVTLKQALNHWIERGLLSADHRFKLEIDKVTESTAYCFTAAEVAAMVRHCRENEQLTWLENVIVGLAYTGVRIGELSQLRWSAVDIKRNLITVVDDSRSKRTKHGNARATKSGKSRLIPIHSELRATLERLHKTNQSGCVFRAQKGGTLRPRNVLQAFIDNVIEPLKEQFPSDDGETGFVTARIHSLRHFFCSLCANEGVAERVLMEWLGHSSSSMVKRYYHLHDDEAQLQMRKLSIIGGFGVL